MRSNNYCCSIVGLGLLKITAILLLLLKSGSVVLEVRYIMNVVHVQVPIWRHHGLISPALRRLCCISRRLIYQRLIHGCSLRMLLMMNGC